jgi:hypothetical protein
MGDKRGFHFLVGLAVLWLLWRLYAAGIIFQAVYYMIGDETVVSNGPGAIIVAFIIEAVITVGWVVTLLTSGIWDGLLVLGRFVSDGFGAAHSYAVKAQAEGEVAVVKESLTTEPARNLSPEQAAIEELSRQVVAIAAKLEAK